MRKLVIAIILVVCLAKCEELIPDRWYDLIYLSNESDYTISYYCADGVFLDYGSSLYPDTLLPGKMPWRTFPVIKLDESKAIITEDYKIDEYFKFPADTLSVFIFHIDTLKKYSWEEVRDGYKILKRYDLSLSDLENSDFTITYP